MDLRLTGIVILIVIQVFTFSLAAMTTTTEIPKLEANDAVQPTTTLANSVNNGGQQPVVTKPTTTPKPLSCKTGTCKDSKDVCTGKSGHVASGVCNAGEWCGLTLGNGNDTMNDYTFSCSAKAACNKNGLKCCSTDNCVPADDNSGCSFIHIRFASIAVVLLAIKAFL